MTKSALRIVRRKHSAWIRYLNTKEGEDYQTYTRSRNTAQHAIRRARRQFERKLAKECRTNNKGIWNYVRNRTNTRGGTGELFKEDGTLTQDDREAAEVLNQHFFKTFTKEDTTNIPHVTSKNLTTETLTTFEITEELVKKCLLQLKTDKSPGTDGISPIILKEMSELLCVPLNIILKLSIDTSTLPRQWRDAIICPIYEKSEKRNAANYRPVSLTSIVCKTLERVIVQQLIEHIKMNHLDCEQQHGFTTGKSVSTNLLEALNIWSEALMHNIPVDVIYLDYAKTFDTVPHQRLLKQVESFGIKDKALAWITAFLDDRRQKYIENNQTGAVY